MNFHKLTWLARAVIGAVVLGTLWLAHAAHEADQAHRKPRLIAAEPATSLTALADKRQPTRSP